jgi:RNA exonuclease NGL2
LKWKHRRHVLQAEISFYKPDILCMQEVDADKFESFWVPTLENLGHQALFSSYPKKRHGLVISFNSSIFEAVERKTIIYDEQINEGVPKQIQSKNNGMLVALKYIGRNDGVILGTTHMFWHPKGSYERTRQLAVLMDQAVEFKKQFPLWPVFLAGDFNSECFDSPYLCATNKPVSVNDHAMRILRESLEHVYTRKELEEGGELAGQNDVAPTSLPVERTISKLIDQFNNNCYQATSIYGELYNQVHPTNVHPRSKGEPRFSNWAHIWRGLLDYIFVLKTPSSDRLGNGEIAHGIKVLELLRLPEPEEMGPEPSGQPREGQYPSDHLCLMATLQVRFQ